MSNLQPRKGQRNINEAIELAVNEPLPVENTSKLTVKEQRTVIKETAIALGVNLKTTEITQLLKETKQNSCNDRAEYVAIARVAIDKFIERMDEQSRQQLQQLATEFVIKVNDSNQQFAEDVKESFRSISQDLQRTSQESRQSITDFSDSLDSTIEQLFV